jgi:hypothetical protein
MPDDQYLLPRPPQAESTQPPEHPKEQRRANIALFIALLAAGFTAWQAWEGHEARLDANETSRVERRAWIAPQNAGLLQPLSKEKVTIEVQYNNPGKEPALDVHPVFTLKQVATSKFEDSTFNSLVEADNICKNLALAPGADVIYPGQPGGYKLQLGLPAHWVTDDVLNRKSAIVLEMCFAYKASGEVHHTSFCYFYRAGLTTEPQLNICTAGNHAD